MKTHNTKRFILFWHTLFIITVLLLHNVMVQAAMNANHVNFTNVSIRGNSTVHCFCQDETGRTWIGTGHGLYCYDGYRTTAHFIKDSFSNNRVYTICSGGNGKLYLGTDNGMIVYDRKTDCYEPVDDKSPKDVRIILKWNGYLWLGTHTGLHCYDLKTKNYHSFKQIQEIINTMTSTPEGLMIGTDRSIVFYDRKQFREISNAALEFKSVRALVFDKRRGCVWIGAYKSIFTYNLSSHEIEKVKETQDIPVKTLNLNEHGDLLIGAENGLYVFAPGYETVHITHDSQRFNSLMNNIIWTIYVDKWHNKWLGTDEGISIWKEENLCSFIPIEQITTAGRGNRFHALLQERDGTVWAGGSDGLIRFSVRQGTFTDTAWFRFNDKWHPFPHNRIRKLYQDPQGDLWVTSDGGLSLYDRKKGQFRTFILREKSGLYTGEWAYDVVEDDYNRLWVAAYQGGIFIIDKNRLLASGRDVIADIYLGHTHGQLSYLHVNRLAKDRNGNIWASFYNNNIDIIDSRTLNVRTIKPADRRTPNGITADRQGDIWVSYENGVLHYTPEGKILRDFQLTEAGKSMSIGGICEVKGFIWVFSGEECWMLNDKVKNACLGSGIPSITSSVYAPGLQKVLLGVRDGIWMISPDIVNLAEKKAPFIQLSALDVNGTPWKSNLEESIRTAKSIILPYNKNNLTFHFTDFPYTNQPARTYMYVLDGSQSSWQYLPSGGKDISLNALPYGTYTLKICTANVDRTPGKNVYQLKIRITPPWYLSVWAKLFYLLVVVALGLWILKFFIMRNRLRMEKLSKERILEQSKAKIDFYTHLSHDLKTPLSCIQGPVSHLLTKTNSDDVRQELECVQRNAALLGTLIHRALDINKIDSLQEDALTLTLTEVVELCRSLLNNFKPAALEKDISLDFSSNVETIYTGMDIIKMESIINNLMSNALKFTPSGGKVSVSVEKQSDGKSIKISVSDSGIGVSDNDKPYIFQSYYQSNRTEGRIEGSGIGLYVVKKYTELMGGSVSVISEINKGSRFTLTIPIDNPADGETASAGIAKGKDIPSILIVEDNEDMLHFIVQLLQPEYRLMTARNGLEGMKIFVKESPDMVLTDLMMPVMDGMEMCLKIRSHPQKCATMIIMLTAKTDTATQIESMKNDVDLFISKPFEPQLLLMQIRRLFARRQKDLQSARNEVLSTPQNNTSTESYDEQLLRKITCAIEEHIENPDFNVNALCNVLNMNEKQVYRKLKQFTGMTTVEYIRNIRMKKAAMYLEQGRFSVAEVMYMVGFTNHSYFSRCFQNMYSMTPKEYMNRNV